MAVRNYRGLLCYWLSLLVLDCSFRNISDQSISHLIGVDLSTVWSYFGVVKGPAHTTGSNHDLGTRYGTFTFTHYMGQFVPTWQLFCHHNRVDAPDMLPNHVSNQCILEKTNQSNHPTLPLQGRKCLEDICSAPHEALDRSQTAGEKEKQPKQLVTSRWLG